MEIEDYSLIANTGIQLFSFPITIDKQWREKIWFHEWFDDTMGENGKWCLEVLKEIMFKDDDSKYYYRLTDLNDLGYLKPTISFENGDFTHDDLWGDGIEPLMVDDEMDENTEGVIFKMTFNDTCCNLDRLFNQWLPMPYLKRKNETNFDLNPLNWVRFKIVPLPTSEKSNAPSGKINCVAIMAVDSRAGNFCDQYREYPAFENQADMSLEFELCGDRITLMDYCSGINGQNYVDKYLFKLVHPDCDGGPEEYKPRRGEYHMSYIASYIYLVNYLTDLANKQLAPQKITLYRGIEQGVTPRFVDMVVDVGNSRTTALLIEELEDGEIHNNNIFTRVRKLQLTDMSTIVDTTDPELKVIRYGEPFDMRLAFRRAKFGDFGIGDSRQFVYPSLVRLGHEANKLIHLTHIGDNDTRETLSTYSSPKRYLWDDKLNAEEWRFLLLEGEPESESTLQINGISEMLSETGKVNAVTKRKGEEIVAGTSFKYSRQSLMTFSFLEMLVQADAQINRHDYRRDRGDLAMPRQIKRLVVTCPTTMTKVEREALVGCAKDAIKLWENFKFSALDDPYDDAPSSHRPTTVKVIPSMKRTNIGDDEVPWYYDEATCAQMVYMYGEIGYKYRKGYQEFFDLYGKRIDDDKQNSLTVASLDIGAGTSDLMINKYSYAESSGINEPASIEPDPKFFDSYYEAGDDILKELIKQVMYMREDSGLYTKMKELNGASFEQFKQCAKDTVGDYNEQTYYDRIMRRDFNLQYSVPLMYYYLELLVKGSGDRIVSFGDVFAKNRPSEAVCAYFKRHFKFDLETVTWNFKYQTVYDIIANKIEPLMKTIATIIYAMGSDIAILSGRPASLPPVRDLLLKYYCVSPDRLILLNNYYVGDWYPYGKNRGIVADAKPIVAVGAAIADNSYGKGNLPDFFVKPDKLAKNLKSTVNFISENPDKEGKSPGRADYLISPSIDMGEIVVGGLPVNLYARQLDLKNYPSRIMFVIEYNYEYFRDRVINTKNVTTDGDINKAVKEEIAKQKEKLPYRIAIKREAPEDLESIVIESITSVKSNDQEDLPVNMLKLHVQTLEARERHWLDTGIIDL